MPAISSIAILLHERHASAESLPYRVWALAANWRRRGLRVELLWGAAQEVRADVLIPHLDLSYVPDDYWELMQRHPNVVNRRLRDVRKRAISAQLVGRDDAWRGPVIVKTDNNSLGWSEETLLAAASPRSLFERVRGRLERKLLPERRRLGRARRLERYHVFESTDEVPRGVWSNPALVVERFVPETKDGAYVVRSYTCFGASAHASAFTSAEPVVKRSNSVMARCEPPPDAILEARRRLGVDYAKMDYVLHGGEAFLLDVNPTPVVTPPIDEARIQRSAELADGLRAFER